MKVAKVRISKEFFEMFLRADFFERPNSVVTSNAPKDLEVLGLAFPRDVLGYPYTLSVYVKSESFEEVLEGQEPPEIPAFVYTVTEVNA